MKTILKNMQETHNSNSSSQNKNMRLLCTMALIILPFGKDDGEKGNTLGNYPGTGPEGYFIIPVIS